MAKLTDTANDSAVEVLLLIRTQALRMAEKPPHFSIPDKTNPRLHTVSTLARIMEYNTAPDDDRIRMLAGETNPNPWKQLKARNRSAKAVAFAESINNELQTYVERI